MRRLLDWALGAAILATLSGLLWQRWRAPPVSPLPVAAVAVVVPEAVSPSVEPTPVDVESAGAAHMPTGGRFVGGLVVITTPAALIKTVGIDEFATMHMGSPIAGGWTWEVVPNPGSATTLKAIGFQGGVLAVGAAAARVVAWRPGTALAELGSWDWPSEADGWMDIAAADFDADGDSDFAAGGYDAGVVMLGRSVDGDVQFEILRARDRTRVSSVLWADLDADGRVELVTAAAQGLRGESGEIEVFSRVGGAWMSMVTWSSTEFFTREIRAGDSNGDRVPEVLGLRPGLVKDGVTAGAVLVEFDRSVVPWRPKPLATIPAPACHSSTFADVDGDGRDEWVGSCVKKGVWTFRKGSVEAVDAQSDGMMHAMAAGDLDNDGRDELYVADEPSREVRKYRLTDAGWTYDVVASFPAGATVFAMSVIGDR